MNTLISQSTDRAAILAELAAYQSEVERQEQTVIQDFVAALKAKDRCRAEGLFDSIMTWNRLRSFVESWQGNLQSRGMLTYVVDSWALQELIRQLTPGKDEEIAYVTGVSIGKVRVLSRTCGLHLEKQSVVYALAQVKSCSDTLVEIHERGNRLHVMAHSHPGKGANSTRPSGIDINYLGRVQRNGADVVGIIVSRDGHVRFFTVETPFQVWVQGNGVKEVEQYVYQVTL